MSSFRPVSEKAATLTGRWLNPAIFFFVSVCIASIGFSVYVKYQLDQAESRLALPESNLTSEQQAFMHIRRDLGYGGFLGLAQTYATNHDASALTDMKVDLRQASEALDHMPQQVNAETRHDLQGILNVFNASLQKAEQSTVASQASADFGVNDLAPLYATLPVLDARVATAIAADRADNEKDMLFWSNLLTLIGWIGLIGAAAFAAGTLIILRDKNAAPMRALAQSVKNMAKGDMRTSIWGMERQDMIGELARAVDMARFYFSQLPDLSLMSEQGPVRIRFEGNTRSMFEAMIRVISRDSEQVHTQASALTEAVVKQQEALAHVVERVEAVLQSVEKRAISGDQQVRAALNNMLGSADSLKHAQEHASDQLNRIVPYLQERAQGLSEITQIAGKQIAQALQSITVSERGLKSSAEESEASIRKFSSAADTLGERMFGAVNLLQASGKVLAETTEKVQSSMNEAVAHIDKVATLNDAGGVQEVISEALTKLEQTIADLSVTGGKLESVLANEEKAARANIDLLTTQSDSLLSQTSAAAQTMSSAADRLRDEYEKLAVMLEKVSDVQAAAQQQEIQAQDQHKELGQALENALLKTSATAETMLSAIDRISEEQTRLVTLIDKTNELAESERRLLAEAQQLDVQVLGQNKELGQTLESAVLKSSSTAETMLSVVDRLSQEQARLLSLIDKTNEIAESSRRDDHAAKTETLKLGEDLRNAIGALEQRLVALNNQITTLLLQQDENKEKPADMIETMREHWFQMAGQIEASRSNLAQIITQQFDRLEATGMAGPGASGSGEGRQVEQQTHILNELVTTLSLLDTHMQELRTQVAKKVG